MYGKTQKCITCFYQSNQSIINCIMYVFETMQNSEVAAHYRSMFLDELPNVDRHFFNGGLVEFLNVLELGRVPLSDKVDGNTLAAKAP